MKKRALSILLACVFLLSVFMFCTAALASEPVSNEADGLSAALNTDKDAYEAGETIHVTLDITNTSIYVNNIRSELIIPQGTTLEEGILQNVAALKVGENVQYTYVLATPAPTTQAPTTQAPTTEPGGDSSPETRDISMLIYGTLAIAALLGLVVLTFGAKLMEKRWLILVICATMLLGVVGPVAVNAAVSEKSFAVNKAITIDGVAAEVKAIVTYDLDDNELMESTEVPYKAEGKFLWNLGEVEQGYYLPSDVKYDGKTTSKDDTYRPEVNAPYIDMLFGTAKVPGMCKVETMFNAEAEKSVLIGRTDDYASLKALEHIDEDEWIVTVIDGKLVVTGWYDNATVAAVKWLKEQVTAGAADIALELPHKGKMDYVDVDLPAVDFGMFLNGIDSDQGNVMLRWNEVDDADFKAYCDALEAAGYELYQENSFSGYKGAGGCFFATYVKGDDVVQVQYLKVSLLCEDTSTLNADELNAYTAACRIDGDEIRLVLSNRDTLGNNEAANNATGWKDEGIVPKMHMVNMPTGDNNGMCQIITLADGSFIVIDGGVAGVTDTVYETLVAHNERADGKIVIAAWVLTHDHADHTAVFQELANSSRAQDITVEQVIVNKAPDSLSWRTLSDPYGYAMGWLGAINNVHTLAEKFAGEAQIVTAHMGQIMHIRNAELEFLSVGSEDVFPVIINNDNACSLVFRVTFDGINDVRDDGDVDSRHSILIFGDSALDQTYNVYFPLFIDELHGDIIQVAHHGLGGQTSRLTPLIKDEDVSVFCMTWPPATDPEYGDLWYRGQNNGLQPLLLDEDGNPVLNPYNKNKPCGDPNGTTGLNIICDEYVYTLVLPFDWETDPVHKTIINQYKSDFFDYNNVKVAYLPAFRFQNTFDTKQAEILKELASYDADVLVVTQIAQKAAMYENQDMVGVLAKELGYAFYHYTPAWGCDADNDMVNGEHGTMGHLVLSRYPIVEAENITLVEGSPYRKAADGGYTEGRAAAHVVLDMEGMLVDIYATHFDNAALAKFAELVATDEYKPVGSYWMIAANNNKGTYENTISALAPVAAGLNNGDYEVYASTGAAFSDPKVQTSWAGTSGITGNQYMGNGYTFTLELSRKVLCDDLEIGEFDDIPSVGQWWVNYLNQATNREQVARWLLKNKHEVVGLVHIPSELLDDEFAAYFAELVGYPYYHVVKIPNPNYGVPYGHVLLSAYPLEPQEDIIIRSEEDSTDKLTAESYGHVIVDMTGTALNTKVDFFFGDMDANDKNGLQMTSQRVALEAAIKAVTDTSGRPFVLLSGYDNGHIKNRETYAGKEFNHQTHPWSNCIVASAPLPMSGREFFGTTAFPENGESPIKISIPNVDPYVKADLAAIPEHQVTVTNGTGDKTYPVGATVTITADAPEKGYAFDKWVVVTGDGVVFADATSAKTTFTMINGAVEVKATYKDVPVVEKDPTGETKELKVAVMPAFRFAGKFAEGENAAKIVENLLAQSGEELWQQGGTADVLALTLMDYDASCGYNSVDMFATLKEAFKDVYEYAYYAPVWKKGATSETDPAAGYLGHMIFSKYEIVDTETYILNTESGGEVRGVGRTTIHVPGAGDTYADVDVFFGHLGSAASWINGETNLYEAVKGSTAEAWLMLGRAYANSVGKAGLEQNLNQSVTSAFGFGGIDIFGSGNLTYKNAGTDKVIYKMFPYKETSSYVDPVYFATVTLPIYEAEGKTKYAVKVEGVNQGFYAAGETVTLTAPDPGVGKRFDSWNLPEGLVLTDNTTAKDKTITFTMPAEILNLTVKNNDVSSFFVYVNGTQVGEHEPGQTVKVTAPSSAAGKFFAGWTIPSGVELKQGYLPAYMTIEFAMPGKDVELTASYADVNTSAEYPTYTAPGSNVENITVLQWWGAYPTDADAAVLEANKPEVAILQHARMSEAQALEFAAKTSYDYYLYVAANTTYNNASVGHLLLSKYPLVHKDTLIPIAESVENSTEGRAYGYVTLNVNGTPVDVFFGETRGGAGSVYDNKDTVEPWVKNHVSKSGNPYIVVAYKMNHAGDESFAGTTKYSTGGGTIAYCGAMTAVEGSAKEITISRNGDKPAVIDLNLAKKVDYTIMQWDVSAFGGSQTHKDATLPIIKEQNKDIVVLNGVQTGNLYGDTIATMAMKMGYPYYHYAEANTNTAGSTRGTLLLSKYPITVLDPIVLRANSNGAEGAAEGRCFGHAQVVMGGKTVDVYYGETDGGSAYAASMTALLAKINENYISSGNPFLIMGYKFTDGDVAKGTYHTFKDAEGNTVSLYSYTAGAPGGGMILSPGFKTPTNGVTMKWFNKSVMYANAPAHYSHGVYGTVTIE